ncbi:DUF5658 family protein [Chloroflexota bacterium]
MRKLAALFVFLFIADAVITVFAVNFAGCVELNPYMAPIAGSWQFPALKIGMAPVFAGAVLAVGRRIRPVALTGFGLMSLFLAVVFAMNIAAIMGLR